MNSHFLKFFKEEMPWRFFRKLALLQIILTTLVISTTAYMARTYLKSAMQQQASDHIHESLDLLDKSFFSQGQNPLKWCSNLERQTYPRFTLLNPQGDVLCDNFAPREDWENHASRPEVQMALNLGDGRAQRYSETLEQDMIYEARSIEGDNEDRYILRQSTSLENLNEAMSLLDQSILLFVLPLILLTSLVSLYGSLQFSSPLRSLLRKVEHMKRSKNKAHYSLAAQSSNSDEWQILEQTLDNAQNDLEDYLNELYLENEKINTLMESISDSILAIDSKQNILFANRQFRKNFSPYEYSEKNLSEFKLWEILRDKEVQDYFNNVLSNQQMIKTRNHHFDIKNGRAKGYFDLKFSPMKNQDGRTFGAVCVFHNVTDRKTAEQLREDFVTNVSHEIRTPLTALKGYVQMLEGLLEKQKEAPPAMNEVLTKIISNSDRLTLLFSDILTLSVIESKRKVQKEWISTQEITHHTISNVKLTYLKKKINIQTAFDCDSVYANPQLLEQVLTNLIDNAYKYTRDGGEIFVRWLNGPNGQKLEVEDNGDKIPKLHHARLFERFYRVDPSRSREQGGTGLGLAIVKHIVQKHYGEIKVDHGPLGGNRFSVDFPSGPSSEA